jgi:hypothetical protein
MRLTVIRATIKNSIGLIALVALSACAGHVAHEQPASGVEQCAPPNTLTCDQFAGENYNCSCERGAKLQDIVDSY